LAAKHREAKDGRQAVALAKKHRPDVVLMDIAMPLLNGLEATRQVLEALPTTKVLMLSAHSDDIYVKSATDSGAMGFLIKQSSAHDVCQAIRQIQTGKKFFSPSISHVPARTQVSKLTLLTLRKSQVFPLQSTLGINHMKLQ
jgi:DNA-binding NarL/FixJ family response regulator